MNKLEANEFLKEFIDRINTQDNVSTGTPILIFLQQKEIIYVGEDCNYEFSKKAKDCDLRESPEDLGLDPEQFLYWREDWLDQAVFFTWDGYNEHLRLNKHNYKKEIRPYVRHAFRNPELLDLYKAIASIVDVPLVRK